MRRINFLLTYSNRFFRKMYRPRLWSLQVVSFRFCINKLLEGGERGFYDTWPRHAFNTKIHSAKILMSLSYFCYRVVIRIQKVSLDIGSYPISSFLKIITKLRKKSLLKMETGNNFFPCQAKVKSI